MKRAVWVVACLFACSCTSSNGGPNGAEANDDACRNGTDDDGDGLTDCYDPDCAGRANCPGVAVNDGGGLGDAYHWSVDGCGGDFYGADDVPPNILILLDRSGSMKETVSGQTKWSIAVAAIQKLLTTYGSKVYFGLAAYPGSDQKCTTGGQCGAGKVFVDVGPNQTSAIASFLGSASTCPTSNPSFRTPLGATLSSLVGYGKLQDTARSNYVLVLTDGKENCSGDPAGAAAKLLGQTVPVKTFAVGFGSGVDAGELSAIAKSGGTAKTTSPAYYQADNPGSLDAAFASIAGSVISCSFKLSKTPPDPGLLFVYFDKVQVNRDASHAAGWDYDKTSNQMTFYGADCDKLKAGQVKSLVIVFGCKLSIT
jgi:hypothetical protein